LEDAGRALAAASGVAFVQEVTGNARELDPEVEDEMFTIGREALSNAFHHARARRVTLALDYRADSVRLAVSADGHGIAPGIPARGAREGHWACPACASAPAWPAACWTSTARPRARPSVSAYR
jgi:signal transduction histidine kinase